MLRRIMLLLGGIAMLLASQRSEAGASTFDFKDPKSISAVSLTIDSMLEPIVGWAKGVSGNVVFDPRSPQTTTAKIAVDVSSVQFANEGYTATAQGFALNGAKYPQIFFTLRKVLSVTEPSPNLFKAKVQADFTCRGITVPLTVPVTASYFPGKAEERTNGKYKGDLLVLRTQFNVSRTRHGISEGIPENMVGDKIEVRVAVVGICYAPEPSKPAVTAPPSASAEDMRHPDGGEVAADSSIPRLDSRTCRLLSADPQDSQPVPARLDQYVDLNETLPEIDADHRANRVSLSDWNRGKTRVLFFFSEQCGVTIFYKQRLQQLQRDFESKGVTFLGVRCGRKEKPEEPLDLAETRYLKMTFVDDAEGALASRFHIKQSLTFAILDRDGKLRYLGGFDDNVTVKRVQKSYLRQALQELAAGKPVTVKTGNAIGCAILPVR